MALTFAALMPHYVPVLSDKDLKCKRIYTACVKIADAIVLNQPDTVVILTPHGEGSKNFIHIAPGSFGTGNLAEYDRPDIRLTAHYDAAFVSEISLLCNRYGLHGGTTGQTGRNLDYGSMVPLYFLRKSIPCGSSPKIVRITAGALSPAEHYRLGMLIAYTARRLGRKIAVIASGNLSHVPADSTAIPEIATEYDRHLLHDLESGSFNRVLSFTPERAQEAAACGHNVCAMLAGCFDGLDVHAVLHGYERLGGVGCAVLSFSCGRRNPQRDFFDMAVMKLKKLREQQRRENDPWFALAWYTMQSFVNTGTIPDLSEPPAQNAALAIPNPGVFVTLWESGKVRGRGGALASLDDPGSAAEALIRATVTACSRHTKYPPVTREELKKIRIIIDIVGVNSEQTAKRNLASFDACGLMLSHAYGVTILLPGDEGKQSAENRLALAKKLAAVSDDTPYVLRWFEIDRHA